MAAELLDPITLSALQHWCYCPRQCALIHVEQVFAENLFTLRGQALHKRVDDPGFEVRDGLRVERALPLFCDRLGLVGKADIVEFSPDGTPYPATSEPTLRLAMICSWPRRHFVLRKCLLARCRKGRCITPHPGGGALLRSTRN